MALVLGLASTATASQLGGSILYEDPAAGQDQLEFRAYVWHAADGNYWKSTSQYRVVGTATWSGLERNWGWYRGQALRAQVGAARLLARDGYLWRFANPVRPPARAEPFRFTEACWVERPCRPTAS